jgi:hypothetical protein
MGIGFEFVQENKHMKEIKDILNKIVTDLEKSAAEIAALQPGVRDRRTARELAIQSNKEFYDSLRKQIDALK